MAVDMIEPGMKLGKAVMSPNGMVMLSEGTELNEKWIERIRDMNLQTVFIDAPAVQTVSREEALAQLDVRFKLYINEPRMATIRNLLKEHIEALYG